MMYRFCALIVFSIAGLAACGGSGGSSDNGVSNSSRSSVKTSSVSSSVANSSSSKSSAVNSSSSVSSVVAGLTPNAASNGSPYCRYDDAESGWGWENGASCVVYQSKADPGVGSFEYCKVGKEALNYCADDAEDWAYANGSYCIARDFCPGNAVKIQAQQSHELVTAGASEEAQAVFAYLNGIWGSKMLSGQMDLTWDDSIDMRQRVIDVTGKAPAIMGYDFMNYGVYDNISGLAQTEEALAHWRSGGLVTFAWHWRDPSNETVNFYVAQAEASKNTNFEIPFKNGELDRQSEAFIAIENDVDLIASELQQLAAAKVPILWRPLHEAAGGWFWWGRERTDGVPAAYAQKLLWRYLYDRLSNYHGLNNLIWVWNGQNAIWYPGDDVVDIVSTDIYDGERNTESQIAYYNLTGAYPHQEKMVALSENSNIPDPDLMQADGAWWLWFMVWNDGAVNTTEDHSSNFWTGEYYNTDAHKKHVYNHERVITLDELPSF
ncbi:glycosyl hydrolase [Gilvimarinus polysaccharolyticus]|uniref:glycosyl hydrolase n=1 Tax=Gilvimarinus polysaccharolyticus TaxID=863921 RepID=UPI00067369EE|nr:glycosyl hydrolase [Gilvimarinus polysaccharolyticus]